MPLADRGYGPLLACAAVTCLTALFAWHQNHGGATGGEISTAKTLWLNLTVIVFLVMPALWWRWGNVHPELKLLFALGFASFLLRGTIELPVLNFTRAWRCSYGIAHDLGMVCLFGLLYARCRHSLSAQDRRSELFLGLYVTLLLVEAGFAWMFCHVVNPATGLYFAGDSERFMTINRLTWCAVILAYPALATILWLARRDFGTMAICRS